MIERICLVCKTHFLATKRDVDRGFGKFCSRICGRKTELRFKLRLTPNCLCAFCGREFWRTKKTSGNNKSGLDFCNRKCKESAQKKIVGILKHSNYNYDNLHAHYRSTAFENLPLICEDCGYNKIPEILEVHHKDKNRNNNELINLALLCPNCHKTKHFFDRQTNKEGALV